MSFDLTFLLFAVVLTAIFWRHSADRKHIRLLQQEATRSFQSMEVESSDEKYRFIGSRAVVERREETGGLRGVFERRASLSVTIHARNEFGERFMFTWHSKSKHPAFIKHMAPPAVAAR